jgi:hypothetical protein
MRGEMRAGGEAFVNATLRRQGIKVLKVKKVKMAGGSSITDKDITNSRILAAQHGKVTFRYKDSRESRWKTMTLDAQEFMRRFLQHVLPRGLHKVRYYGLLSPRNRQRLEQIRRELTNNTQTNETETSCLNDHSQNKSAHSFLLCPLCKKGYMVSIMALPRRWRAPP